MLISHCVIVLNNDAFSRFTGILLREMASDDAFIHLHLRQAWNAQHHRQKVGYWKHVGAVLGNNTYMYTFFKSWFCVISSSITVDLSNIYNRVRSDMLEKYLNLEGFLEKSLKIKSALKSTGKSLKSLEKPLNCTISVGLSTYHRELNQYKNCCACIWCSICCTKYRVNNVILIFHYNTNVSIISV